jgi:DNA-binding NarL/FixJ family response regulator
MTTALLSHYSPAMQPATDSHHGAHDMNVLVADDRRARSYRIWASLRALTDVGSITTGESIEEVLRLALHHAPRVSVVSATFGDGQGLSLTHRLKHGTAPPSVLVYADAVDPFLAGAAIIAGADGAFAWEADAGDLGELIERVVRGEKLFPPLVPDPFGELASHVAEEDRRIVAMLLEGAHPDTIARLFGIGARELRLRRRAVVRCLEAAYALAPIPQPRTEPSPPGRDDRFAAASRPLIVA